MRGRIGDAAGEAARARAVRHARLAVARRVDGLLSGDHSGRLPGPGDEPDATRPYEPGDDVRRIDWSVTARTGTTHVRTTTAAREQVVTVVVDLTPSMAFGTVRWQKRDLAAVVAAAAAQLSAGPGDRLRGVVVTADGVRVVPAGPPASTSHLLLGLLVGAEVEDAAPAGAHDADRGDGAEAGSLATALDVVVRTVRRPGLVVVVTDLVVPDPDVLRRPLRRLAAHHDVVVVEVLDPRELRLPSVGLLHLVDPETGRALHVDSGRRRLRERYAEAAADARAARRAVVRASGATHLVLRTDRDWLPDLVASLSARRRARGAARPLPSGASR